MTDPNLNILSEKLAQEILSKGAQIIPASGFIPNSINNIDQRMHHLEESDDYLYGYSEVYGAVYGMTEVLKARSDGYGDLVPVMKLGLRDSSMTGRKQIHRVRVLEGYDPEPLVRRWCFNYLEQITSTRVVY